MTEAQIAKLSDAELKGKTAELKVKLDNGATLDDMARVILATPAALLG